MEERGLFAPGEIPRQFGAQLPRLDISDPLENKKLVKCFFEVTLGNYSYRHCQEFAEEVGKAISD